MRTLLTIVHTSRRRRRREYLMCWKEAETYKKIMMIHHKCHALSMIFTTNSCKINKRIFTHTIQEASMMNREELTKIDALV